MSHQNDVPLDPKSNLERLQSINEHLHHKKTKKQAIRDQKQALVEKIEAILAKTPARDELSEEDLATAKRQEQIMVCAQLEVEDLDEEIRQLSGKVRWNESKQDQVERLMQRQGDLTYTLAEKLSAE